MKKLLLIVLVLGLSILSGCGTITKTQDIVSFVHQQKKELEALVEKGQEEVDKRLDAIEADAAKTEADLANVGVTLDANGDGKIEFGEGAEAIRELAKGSITDGGKRDLLTNPDTYKGIGAAVLA